MNDLQINSPRVCGRGKKKPSNLNMINFFSFHLSLTYSSHAILSLPLDGELYLTEISSDTLLERVKTVSELGKLSPHPLLLKMTTSSLLD